MKVVIPGGSGQVGTILARAFHADGDDVVVLSRHPSARPWRVVPWDGITPGTWESEIDGCDAVINLAGGAEPDAPSTWRFSIDVAHRNRAHSERPPRGACTTTRAGIYISVSRLV